MSTEPDGIQVAALCLFLSHSSKKKSTSLTSGGCDAQYSLCCHCRLSHTLFGDTVWMWCDVAFVSSNFLLMPAFVGVLVKVQGHGVSQATALWVSEGCVCVCVCFSGIVLLIRSYISCQKTLSKWLLLVFCSSYKKKIWPFTLQTSVRGAGRCWCLWPKLLWQL